MQDIQRCHQVSGFEVITNQGTLYSKYVINAAGVYADEIHNMVSEKKLHHYTRRVNIVSLIKIAGTLVSHTIFQVPGEMGKGVLVTPTIHGNLMIGQLPMMFQIKKIMRRREQGLIRC